MSKPDKPQPITLDEVHDLLLPMANEVHKDHVVLHGDGNGTPGLKSDFRAFMTRVDGELGAMRKEVERMYGLVQMGLKATLFTFTAATVAMIVKMITDGT